LPRPLWLLLLTAWGCGRLGYDAVSVRAGSPDAAPAAASDGARVEAGPVIPGPDAAVPPGPPPATGVIIIGESTASSFPFVYNGSAQPAGDVVRLILGGGKSAGSAFLRRPFGLRDATTFKIDFAFRVYAGDGTVGGDGLALVLQSSNAGSSALGLLGGNLGYAPIQPSVGVELDTFMNPTDPNNNHMAIDVDGDTVNSRQVASNLPFDINDGVTHHVWFEYDGPSKTVRVYASANSTKPAQPLLTDTIDLVARLGSQMYVGFTSATALFTNTHDIETLGYDFRY